MNEDLVLQTKNGPIRGSKKLSVLNIEYLSFQKIPYAKPPVNELRFKAPVPVDSWTTALDCTVEGPASLGFNTSTMAPIGEEDSLHLNIFMKNVDLENLLPVMVYIYGGAFMRGSSTTTIYGPDYFLQKDVVLVSLNYRMGAFGFLSLETPELDIPGNAGLKDQRLALQWVKQNISCFGGDPDNITVFGNSAGSISIQYHMASESSKGLFSKAILMSGSAITEWILHSPKNKEGETLATTLGWNGSGGELGALKFLEKAEANDIILAQETAFKQDIEKGKLYMFGPVIEPYISMDCFIPKDPIMMCREGWGNKLDILIGYTADEGIMYLRVLTKNPTMLDSIKDFQSYIPEGLNDNSEEFSALGKKILALYYGVGEKPSATNSDGYLKLVGDKYIGHAVHRTILSRKDRKNYGKTFVYRFAVDSVFQNGYRLQYCGPNVKGSAHADDLCYLFKTFYQPVPQEDSFEYKTIQIMVDTFTCFAKNGDPNGPAISPTKWEPLNDDVMHYKVFNIANDGPSSIDQPEADRMEFWDSMYKNINLF